MSNGVDVNPTRRNKDVFLGYRIPYNNQELRHTHYRIQRAKNRVHYGSRYFLTLEDVCESGWSFGFIYSEEELLFVQKLIAEWDNLVPFRGCNLIVTSVDVAIAYENIIGVKIWLRDHVAPVNRLGPCTSLSISASVIYMYCVNELLNSVARGPTQTTIPGIYWISNGAPCFKFLTEEQVDDWKPNATSSDYYSSITVDLISNELADYINFVIRREGLVGDVPFAKSKYHT